MKTHRLAGRIWVIGSLLMIPVVFFSPDKVSAVAFFSYVAVITIVPTVYSWKLHKELMKNKEAKH
jgi:energy-coupling factor transporter transmembrane protein EcfT